MDKQDSKEYHDKFSFFSSHARTGRQFGERDLLCVVLVSHTGLVVSVVTTNCEHSLKSLDGSRANAQKVVAKSLDNLRQRIKKVDITVTKSGTMLIATTNGDPLSPVNMYKVCPKLLLKSKSTHLDSLTISMEISTFPGLFIHATSMESKSEEDVCQEVVDLKFVIGDDRDSFLVATKHPAGGRVELWELKEVQQSMHKMFLGSLDASPQAGSTLHMQVC